ncbi:MAG: RDD family protein [Deltaproteobacteria bacterium]|nr:RDD family protein [Deltaproteobacteria bacterium]
MPFDEPDETQLIDVADLKKMEQADFGQEPTELQERTHPERPARTPHNTAEPAPPTLPEMPVATTDTLRIASAGERFTAFFIDSYVLFAGYWAQNQLYHRLAHGHWDAPAPTNLAFNGIIFHLVYLFAALGYFVVSEGLFGTTPGKWCCGLTVRRLDGDVPGWGTVLLRNAFRPLDYLLLGLATEFSERHQRLGDRAAGTAVITRTAATAASPVAWDRIAKTSGRLIAAGLDAALLFALLLGWLLQLNPERAFVSQWILLLGPLAILLLWAGLQRFAHTTPGGWICGYRLVQENGAPIGFAHALLRTAFTPLDCTPAGPLAMAISPRRQRLGDFVAGTLVVQGARHAAGWTASVVLAVVLLGLAYGASRNPERLFNAPGQFNQDFRLTFVPRTELAPDFPPVGAPTEPFDIQGFRFAEARPDNMRVPPTYVPGETAYLVFEVHGFRTTDRMVWVQEDLAIRYPDGAFGLRQENIIDYHVPKHVSGPLQFTNQIYLPPGIPLGQHTVYITLRDKLAGGGHRVYTQTFTLKSASPPMPPVVTPQPSEPGAAPPPPTTAEPPATPPMPSAPSHQPSATSHESPEAMPASIPAPTPPTAAPTTAPPTRVPAPSPPGP